MLSRFYVGTVSHGRGAPAHGFSYRVWYAWLDLDGIDEFCSSSLLISKDRFNLLSYCRQDYLPGEGTLGDAVRTRVAEQTGAPFTGKVFALTTLRQLGVCMNPISLYYCYPAAKSEPGYVVVEVHNTPWGERHSYVLAWDGGSSAIHQVKELHVSPFMPMDLDYEFALPAPGEELRVGIKVLKNGDMHFAASLDLQALPQGNGRASQVIFSYGWQPIMTAARIYYQALRLWLKKARFFPHPERGPLSSQHSRKSVL